MPKILKQIFPEKELCSRSPNFHIHVSVGDLNISTITLPILLQENTVFGPILGIYTPITDTHHNSQKRNTCVNGIFVAVRSLRQRNCSALVKVSILGIEKDCVIVLSGKRGQETLLKVSLLL
jgi:hypothetical protein